MPNFAGDIADLAEMEKDMRDLKHASEELKFRLNSELTTAIYNMAKNGEVDLTQLFGSSQDRHALGKKLRVLIGYRWETTPRGLEKFVPPVEMEGTDKLSNMTRTIASVTLTKCARVALYLIQNNFTPEIVRSPNFTFITHTAKGKIDMRAKAKRIDKPQGDSRH